MRNALTYRRHRQAKRISISLCVVFPRVLQVFLCTAHLQYICNSVTAFRLSASSTASSTTIQIHLFTLPATTPPFSLRSLPSSTYVWPYIFRRHVVFSSLEAHDMRNIKAWNPLQQYPPCTLQTIVLNALANDHSPDSP